MLETTIAFSFKNISFYICFPLIICKYLQPKNRHYYGKYLFLLDIGYFFIEVQYLFIDNAKLYSVT